MKKTWFCILEQITGLSDETSFEIRELSDRDAVPPYFEKGKNCFETEVQAIEHVRNELIIPKLHKWKEADRLWGKKLREAILREAKDGDD